MKTMPFRSAFGRLARTPALLLTLTLVAAGCSGPPAWDKVNPVSGSVTFKGTPIEGALLVFYPKDKAVPDSIRPTATTGPGGAFKSAQKAATMELPQVITTW